MNYRASNFLQLLILVVILLGGFWVISGGESQTVPISTLAPSYTAVPYYTPTLQMLMQPPNPVVMTLKTCYPSPLYPSPTFKSKPIALVQKDTEMNIIGRSSDLLWVAVRFENVDLWIPSALFCFEQP